MQAIYPNARRAALICAVALLFACSGGSRDHRLVTTNQAPDAGSAEPVFDDETPSDDPRRARAGDDPTSPGDGDGRNTPIESFDPECQADPGSVGCACETGDDCDEGWCVASRDALVCTSSCDAGCPATWTCERTDASGPDTVFLCLPGHAHTCAPCRVHADCRGLGTDVGAFCVDYGPEGSFCGSPCDLERSDCPSGHVCERVRVDGVDEPVAQCVPSDGICECSDSALGAETDCLNIAPDGACGGVRSCTEAGLSECRITQTDEGCQELCTSTTCDVDGANCDVSIRDGWCFIAGGCFPTDVRHPESACKVCDPERAMGRWSESGVDACDDGAPCTHTDRCDALECRGVSYSCSDGDSCTDDVCVGDGTCAFPVAADRCRIDGVCHDAGAPAPADPCRACIPEASSDAWSIHFEKPCDDGDPCSVGDRCVAEGCEGAGFACDDGLSCTGDACDGDGGCTNILRGGWCVIDDACHADGASDPTEPCRRCDVALDVGAWQVHLDGPCDDGTACTDLDECIDGTCVSGTGADCDDANPCTVDRCDPEVGCAHESVESECDDDNPCTDADVCVEGQCRGEPLQCPDREVCHLGGCYGPAELGILAASDGEAFTCYIQANGRVACWGHNRQGQLGSGLIDRAPATPLVYVHGIDDAISVSAGVGFACAVHVDGGVSCWGMGPDGQLGTGFGDSALPGRVPGLTGAVQVAAGGGTACARDGEGSVHCWGRGDDGQLGDGRGVSSGEPVQVAGLSGAVDVAVGDLHACAVDAQGRVHCWGSGEGSRLGDATLTGSTFPVLVPGVDDAIDLDAGPTTCAVRSKGTVWCWGANDHGQLGHSSFEAAPTPVRVSNVGDAVRVSCGTGHCCALRMNGQLWCWGGNGDGQLGNGLISDSPYPVSTDGVANVVAVALHARSGCTLDLVRRITCWGNNDYGQYGSGREGGEPGPDDALLPRLCGAALGDCDIAVATGCETRLDLSPAHCGGCGNRCELDRGRATCVDGSCQVARCDAGFADCDGESLSGCETKLADSPLHCGACGQECAAGETCRAGACVARNPTAVRARVASGSQHTCGITADGATWCWGDGGGGRLGHGGWSAEPVPVPSRAVSGGVTVAVGRAHGCAAGGREGLAWCWGTNGDGQLGDGTTGMRPDPAPVVGLVGIVGLAAGDGHTCARTRTGTVWCWGEGRKGQSGRSDWKDALEPVQIEGLGGIVDLAAGARHACALDASGGAWCWGHDDYGQLGRGPYDGPSRNYRPVAVVDLTGARDIAAGGVTTCAVDGAGRVLCWGNATGGLLGVADLASSPSPVEVGAFVDAVAVAVGGRHACVVHEDGGLSCWGENRWGQLGDGSQRDRRVPARVDGVVDAVHVSAGLGHTCAVGANDAIRCWGDNRGLQLGLDALGTRLLPRVVVFD